MIKISSPFDLQVSILSSILIVRYILGFYNCLLNFYFFFKCKQSWNSVDQNDYFDVRIKQWIKQYYTYPFSSIQTWALNYMWNRIATKQISKALTS